MLILKDLEMSEELDNKAMASIHGGVAPGGCIPPYTKTKVIDKLIKSSTEDKDTTVVTTKQNFIFSA